MQKREYYLLYLDKDQTVKNLNLNEQFFYQDITEIDLYTLQYTKEEFLKKYLPGKQIKDLFIGRLTKNQEYHFSYYECFFIDSKKSHTSMKATEYMKNFALERLRKTKELGKIELNTENPKFIEYLTYLIKQITSNQSFMFSFIHNDNLKDQKLKEYILNYNENKSIFSYIAYHLKGYKQLRFFSLQYLNILNEIKENQFEKNYVRDCYSYQSSIFDFTRDFPITISEASMIQSKDFYPKYLKERNDTVKEIKNSAFDSEEIEYFYQMGGVEYVLNNMDTNRLYNSTEEDLLRLGLLSPEDYLRQKFGSTHKSKLK